MHDSTVNISQTVTDMEKLLLPSHMMPIAYGGLQLPYLHSITAHSKDQEEVML